MPARDIALGAMHRTVAEGVQGHPSGIAVGYGGRELERDEFRVWQRGHTQSRGHTKCTCRSVQHGQRGSLSPTRSLFLRFR